MRHGNFKKSKKMLSKNLEKYEDSINMQMSASKILCFLINDMLDYAQLSAGQFRKFMSKFNLNDSINDVVKIMRFKAN